MIIEEIFHVDDQGVKLIRRYSDKGVLIRQVDTGFEYAEAIDIETSPHTYEETDTPIDAEEEEDDGFLTAQESLDIIFGEETTND